MYNLGEILVYIVSTHLIYFSDFLLLDTRGRLGATTVRQTSISDYYISAVSE